MRLRPPSAPGPLRRRIIAERPGERERHPAVRREAERELRSATAALVLLLCAVLAAVGALVFWLAGVP